MRYRCFTTTQGERWEIRVWLAYGSASSVLFKFPFYPANKMVHVKTIKSARTRWAMTQRKVTGRRDAPLCQEPSEIRPAGLGHLYRTRRRKQQEEPAGGGGRRGPKQACPATRSGRKQSSVGPGSAEETSRSRVRERRREAYKRAEVEREKEEWKRKGRHRK